MDYFKLLAIISPFLAAFLTTWFAHLFSIKLKKFDTVYQNKLNAVNKIVSHLIDLKMSCYSVIVNSEISAFIDINKGILEIKNSLEKDYISNSIYINSNSRKLIEELIKDLDNICLRQITFLINPDLKWKEYDYETYSALLKNTEYCIKSLYESNLK